MASAAWRSPGCARKTNAATTRSRIGVVKTGDQSLSMGIDMNSVKLPALLALIKSPGDPLLDVAGAYFPAWLGCMIAGALGTLIVLVFFSVGQLVLGAVLKNNPQNAMMVAMALYLGKIGALLVLLLVLQDATFFAPKVFAGVIVACTLAWT